MIVEAGNPLDNEGSGLFLPGYKIQRINIKKWIIMCMERCVWRLAKMTESNKIEIQGIVDSKKEYK